MKLKNAIVNLRWFTVLACILVTLTLVFLATNNTPSISAQGPGVHGPFTTPALRAASFDGDVRRLPRIPEPVGLYDRVEHQLPEDTRRALSTAGDSARQAPLAVAGMPAPIQNFKGLDFYNWGSGWPPDTNGDVGPNHYIQTVNSSVGIFSKTGTLLAAYSLNTFFNGTNTPCDNANYGDPVVLYDSMADRWIIADFSWADYTAGPFYECIAVSRTSDPIGGGWWQWGLLAHTSLFSDYPKLGVWPDGYYMSANLFDSAGSYAGTRVWALDRASMLNGTLRAVYFDLSTSYSSLLPSNLRGALPPSGSPNFFAARGGSGTLQLWKFHVNWSNTSLSTLNGPVNLAVAGWSIAGDVPQLNGNALDSLSSRLMMQNQYRNIGGTESLWLNHTVSSNGVAAVRWYEIRNPSGSPSVRQQSTFQPDGNHRWMGSLAVDGSGDMALGYSISSASRYPGINYAGRLVSDPINTLGQGERTLIAGTGSQTNSCGNGLCGRWGDYSALTVDPSDNCTFWYTTEYYEASGGNWQTRIGSFRFPSCTGAPLPSPTVTPHPTPEGGWFEQFLPYLEK